MAATTPHRSAETVNGTSYPSDVEKNTIEKVETDSNTLTNDPDLEVQGYANKELVKRTHSILDDPEMKKLERRFIWKLDLIVLPTVSALYFFAYLDRGNVANAKLYGLANGHDTKYEGVGPGMKALSAEQWEVIIMIFFVGLILFQVPGCWGYRVFSPSKVGTA